jgi:hypothetical protein
MITLAQFKIKGGRAEDARSWITVKPTPVVWPARTIPRARIRVRRKPVYILVKIWHRFNEQFLVGQ